jgi:hypothetical protein
MSRAPDAITVPRNWSMPSPSPNSSSTRALCHSLRQYRQTSRSLPGFWRTSVEPHLGQRLTPSSSSFDEVSIATGSGASISLRIGSGRVAGSIGNVPRGGGVLR